MASDTQKIPENLNYAVIGSMVIMGVATVISLATQNMLGLLIGGGLIAAIYWFGYRNLLSDPATAKMALLMCGGVCALFALLDLVAKEPIYFILSLGCGGALGFAFFQLQQAEQRATPNMAPPVQPAAPPDDRAAKLRMLEDLHRSGVLTDAEFAQKRRELGAG